MKKSLIAAMLVSTSFSAISAPYIGLEYGFSSTEHEIQSNFKDTAIQLEPKSDEGILNGFVGYNFNDAWGIELGYSQYKLEDSRTQLINATTEYKEEREWQSHIKANQISIAPVFTHNISDRWLAKIKAGLTYTMYDYGSSQSLEKEFHLTDHEVNQIEDSHSNSTNEIGGLISLGTEFKVINNLTIGMNLKYQFDNTANTASVNLGSTYYF